MTAAQHSTTFSFNGNLLDKDPPVVGASTCPAVLCNGNTFPQVYETLGRYVFLGITADF
jgi:iron complex outermembrane recepter protein